jgi:vacuolar-type H+-ATPase subunit H
MHAKLSKRRETSPALPDTPAGARSRAKIFPQWMYRDPVEVVERVESAERLARERVQRLRELDREQSVKRAQSAMRECLASMVRVVLAPPEIRLKRARIQRLAREAMKERK